VDETQTLADCYSDVFATIFAFRSSRNEDRPSYRAMRSRMEALLADTQRAAEATGRDVRGDAQYAVVALVDETMSASDWEHAEEWAQKPLQVQYFGRFVGGEEFFHRLDTLTQGGSQELLEVFFTCLCAGFSGMLGDDPDALATRRRRLFQALKRAELRDEAHITEPAYGRNLERTLARSHFPFSWLLPFAGVAVFVYVALWLVLRQQVGEIIGLAG
jgi:type IV/VI secretion system ImpK/VasF family protein